MAWIANGILIGIGCAMGVIAFGTVLVLFLQLGLYVGYLTGWRER